MQLKKKNENAKSLKVNDELRPKDIRQLSELEMVNSAQDLKQYQLFFNAVNHEQQQQNGKSKKKDLIQEKLGKSIDKK